VDLTPTDRIRLSVPAATPAVRIVRAGAAGLATRAGFTYHEVEQIQLAVGEAAALLAHDPGGEGALVVTFDVEADGLVVELEVADAGSVPPATAGPAPSPGGPADVPEIASAVLDAAVDEWRVEAGGRRIVLRKSLPEPDLDDD
jgi:anti-sigma regulatory factor (Ser/Thr protein kinase)